MKEADKDQGFKSLTGNSKFINYLKHQLIEAQFSHKVYKINPTHMREQNGKKVSKLRNEVKLFALHVTALIYLGKTEQAMNVINQYGVQFYDLDLAEATIRRLLGIAIFHHKEEDGKQPDYSLALKEMMKAEIIYRESDY